MNDIPGVRLPTALSKFKSWLGLSEALTQRPDTLPEPQGRPPVWANGRQALCETVPYFRAFQGGTCRYNGFVRGFLFDNSCIDRDFMDSNVVIARTSGGMGRKTKDGDMVPIKDQGESSIFEAIMNNMVQHNPVAVISGQQNPKMPSQMPYIYNILDWYKITHVWHEEYNGIIIGRLRLEKLSAGPSWWTPKGGSEIVQLGQLPPTQQTCPECRSQSPQIYLCGWMCVMWKCTRFWTLPNGLKPLGADLRYDPRFLKCHTWWRNTCEPQPLVPDRRFRLSFKDLSSESVKGIVCPECGCCIQRVEWARYKCENEHCSHVYETPHEVIQPEEVQKYYRPPTSYYAPSNDKWGENVVWKLLFRDNYRINIFEVEGGKIAHLIANSTVNEETGGPDDMFRELQEADMGAKRACLPRDQHKGETYMTSFMVNYGMPYKFIAATAEKTFEEAPAKAIKLARSRLIWAVKMLFEQDPGFNELLLVQYMSEQKMDYHDDGEAGLGPIVAAQSLGFGSEMRFRQKAKYYFGVTKSQDTLNERPIQGCFKYEERMRAWLELQTLPAEAKKLRREQLVKELGLRSKRSPMDAITLRLCHGDVVIMVGSKLQKYYEHSVTGADGNIRFALTCRHIDPASLKPEQLPATEVLPDDIHYDGSQLPQVPSPPPPPQPLE
ncbi:hypothetical protein M501DRAFT_943090 [Patellaria atrata CBS 101060]|uniref:Alpha-ketoglutarate-dependent dioxygenase AlkB-like domain-containing protein n=1 Tax=Patellaria atrata CBS 101060 TaxID=1346257 RepID=A0A9P4S453_9PEZI|nr:hypothetical protein M501DRAFT_943090 [Patellaria atrata CBS 101060]